MTTAMLLRSEFLEVELLPEVGGKISAIRRRDTGHSLLVPAQRPFRQVPYGAEWIDYDTSGMDDCFPNIEVGRYPWGPWAGRELPQQGEWVFGGWDVEAVRGQEEVVLGRDGALLPYRARKTVTFSDPETLLLSYAVENRSSSPLAYLWAAHPLISVGPEFELRLPGRGQWFRTFPSDGKRYEWPRFGALDLSREEVSPGTNLKIFVAGLQEGSCELILPEYTLRVEFDLASTPALGIWLNNFGFPSAPGQPFRCIAVEPTTSISDSLEDLPAEAYPVIPPHGTARWWVSLRLKPR